MSSYIVYDCEIVRAIPCDKEECEDGIEYCDGWDDIENMGISVICAYDSGADEYRVFMRDNFDEFQKLVDSVDRAVGFNNRKFDDRLCVANGIKIPQEKSFDLLVAMWQNDGLGPVFEYKSHIGYGLDATAKANGIKGKTGNGAFAPVLWQQGKYGQVVDYCLHDVKMTAELFWKALDVGGGGIKTPKTGKELVIGIDHFFGK